MKIEPWLQPTTTAIVERLEVLKTAWILGNGHVPQPWFRGDAHRYWNRYCHRLSRQTTMLQSARFFVADSNHDA